MKNTQLILLTDLHSIKASNGQELVLMENFPLLGQHDILAIALPHKFYFTHSRIRTIG
ncbi:hypothetical protein [[Phormidium ambiguum] IAM M-71]|uniref:hypothetical protein n=1 Tax=[Phormidium ambiguum] IAM M-71 TaxID=454136 RepID=UPI0015BDE581|nr:hypothetical protein [Phormidium ambiguum]